MLQQFLELVNTNGDRNAICISGTFTSYSELADRIAGIQQYLQEQHPTQKTFALEATDSVDVYAAIMALLLAGKSYVPLHPSNPASRNAEICRQAKTEFILCSEKNLLDLESGTALQIQLNEIPSAEKSSIQYCANSEDIAYILFTSGSTGVPKGVPITHANLEAFCKGFYDLGISIGADDRCLQMFELTFDLSVMSYLLPLLNGACFYTVPQDGIKFMKIYELLEEENITIALMVPSVINYLRPYFEDINLPSMRYSLFCGEALPYETARLWQASVPYAKVLNVYGPTEATIFCTAAEISEAGSYNGICGIGKSMSEVECMIADECGNPLEHGKGELCLAGKQVTAAYLNNERKNAESFFSYNGKRFYRTGDLCYMDGEQRIFYCGRLDQQVKVMGGYRVELGEIEHHARHFIGSENAIAVASQTASGTSSITLFVHPGSDLAELRTELGQKLPAYMMPSAIVDINEFPLNSNGKTDRRALAEKAASLQAQVL